MTPQSSARRPRVVCHLAASIDGRMGLPALFDLGGSDAVPRRLVLEAVERRADDILWLRYRVRTGAA